jgi:NAD(P)-dependent dehydrogenase (short-subunit alcohol dehydrogenase family)
MDIGNCRAIVTGGGSGYGKGIAKALVSAGAEVWITGRNADRLAAAADETGARPFVADASCAADWDRLFAEVADVDILVNNAGFGGTIAPLAEQSDSAIAEVIATNLTGAIMGASRAAKIMSARRRGVIVNISSVCALHAWPGWSVYTAAKAGLLKFSRALYTEMRPSGVRVTCVIPSWGQTGFNRSAGISGASEDPVLAEKCISPDEIGRIVADIVALPDHLAVPEIVVQPVIQEIVPM